MATVTFATGKSIFAEFTSESLEAERQASGMLLTAQGELTRQDTPLLEQFLPASRECHVTIRDNGQDVISALFRVTFFELEPDRLTVQLAAA